jgi:serine protease
MPKQAQLPEGYIPHIAVKFRDEVRFPYEDGVEKYFEGADAEFWQQLRTKYPGISLRRQFDALASADGEVRDPAGVVRGIRELVDRAKKYDPDYQPPNLFGYYVIDIPPGVDLLALASDLREWRLVETAYVSGLPGPPPAPSYLDAAPDGIGARPFGAAVLPGNLGAGVKVVDIEQGWQLVHPDLPTSANTLLFGINVPTYRNHGLAVLSVLAARSNTTGAVGIAPDATIQVVSEWGPDGKHDTARALAWVLPLLSVGDVVLLETQYYQLFKNSNSPPPQPVEMQLAVYTAIRLATAAGIIVIEAAGNGGTDMANLQDERGKFVLNPNSADRRDSRAIVVGACDQTTRAHRATSNFGARVNCFAWGDGVLTLSAGGGPLPFNGTSSATAIIAGAALLVQSRQKHLGGQPLGPAQMRSLLGDSTNGMNTPSANPGDLIGVMPNLARISELLPR